MNFTEIKELLLSIKDPVDKLETVMDLGKQLPTVPENAVCKKITGCASTVIICNVGTSFYGAADSAMVRGVVFIMISMVQGKTPDEIRDIDFLSEIKSLDINIGAGRMMGVNSIIGFLQNL